MHSPHPASIAAPDHKGSENPPSSGMKEPEQLQSKMESPAKHDIRNLTDSEDDFGKICQLWQTIFPKWPIDPQRLGRLLYGLPGLHYIHEKGFCLSFLDDGKHGKIAAVGVLPEYRGKGLGIALMETAQAGLRRAACEDGGGGLSLLEIGSLAPRFWPQVPVDFPPEVGQFFLNRGISHAPTQSFVSKVLTTL